MPTAPAGKLELETRRFWGRVADELGDIAADPAYLWDARLGYFGVRPDQVGELTPAQLLDCVDLFAAIHGAG